MPRPVPKISKSRADRAGKLVRDYIKGDDPDDDELWEAVRSIRRWRQTHAYPLALVTSGIRNWVSHEPAALSWPSA